MSFSLQRQLLSSSRSAARFSPAVEALEDRVLPALLGQSLFPADYPTNNSIANAPVSTNSAAWIAAMAASESNLVVNWGAYTPGSGGPLYSMPYNVVHSKDTADYTNVKVYIDNYPNESDLSGTDPTQQNRAYVLVPMPKVNPQNLFIEGDNQNGPNPARFTSGGSDSHLLVWDADTNTAYEFWETSRPSESSLVPSSGYYNQTAIAGQWNAANEATWNMTADTLRTLGYTSGDAAGLPILANIVRPDEVLTSADGGDSAIPAITHALRFTLKRNLISDQFAYPASHVASGSGGIPYGTRFRLLNNATVNALIAQMGPESQVIAHALQTYGLILADIGSSMFVQGAATSVDTNNNPIIDPLTGKPITWNMNDLTPDQVSGKYTVGLDSLLTTYFVAVNPTPEVISLSALSGPAGTTLTITGLDFSGSAGHLSVLFVPSGNNPPYTSNGQTTTLNAGVVAATTFMIKSDSLIQVVVPNGLTGTVDVEVLSGQLLDDTYNSDAENATAPIFGYGISAQNSGDKFTYNASGLSVSPSSLPNWTVNQANYSSTISAGGGTGPYTFALTGSLPTGLGLNTSTGAITGTPTATGTFNFTIKATDTKSPATGSQAYSVVIDPAVSVTTTSLSAWTMSKSGYNQSVTTSGGTGSITFSITVGSLPTGLSINAATGAITGTPTTTGTFNFTITATDSDIATGSKALSIVINPIVSITTTSLPSWTANKPGYSTSVAATGGTGSLNFSITVGSLPTGLSLNAATGAISGTPTSAGTFNFTIAATDGVGASGSKALSILINPGVSITTTALPNWTVNVAGYSQTITATGGTSPYTFALSANSLPTGLLLAAATGAITGTPTATGTFTFTITATDKTSLTGSRTFTVTINAIPKITTSNLGSGTANQSGYSQTLTTSGGTGPLVFSFTGGQLPPGLSLNFSSGAITGTPTTAGTFHFTITITDAFGVATSTAQTIVINAAPAPPTAPSAPSAPSNSQPTFIVGAADSGGGPQITVFDPTTGVVEGTFYAFAPNFTGGVRVAVGEDNGTPIIVCATGPGGGPQIAVFNGTTFQLMASFDAFAPSFTGGSYVAVGDVFGTGYDDIILGADKGGGPQVTVFDGKTFQLVASFYAFAPNFTGGVRVAAGDVNSDGLADIICGAGPGAGPQVTVFSGGSLTVLESFSAFVPTFTGGVYVAAGDVTGAGHADIITGAAPGGGPQVTVFDGLTLQLLQSFYALAPSFTGGVRVGVADVNGREAIVAAAGAGGGPQVATFDSSTLALLDSFYATTPSFTGGLFVA